jgi:hypothetical protein
MAAIDELLTQIRTSFLQDLMPGPSRKVAELGTNQFHQIKWGDGNLIIGYNASGIPLTMKIVGVDGEDLSVLSSHFIDHVRIIETKDSATAQKLADIFEAAFGPALVLDEPNRRRIRRASRQTAANGDVPPGFVRDRTTGELRAKLRPGRRKE